MDDARQAVLVIGEALVVRAGPPNAQVVPELRDGAAVTRVGQGRPDVLDQRIHDDIGGHGSPVMRQEEGVVDPRPRGPPRREAQHLGADGHDRLSRRPLEPAMLRSKS